MSLNLESKKVVVADVAKVLSTAQTVVVAEYQGVTVAAMTTLRAKAREAGVYLQVVKNTLVRIAVTDTQFAPLATKLVGPLVYAVSDDPVAAAKIISDFAKDNAKVKIIAGMYNTTILDEAGVKQLAAIPSRDELLAMVMGVMQQIPASLVRVIAALKDKREQEQAA